MFELCAAFLQRLPDFQLHHFQRSVIYLHFRVADLHLVRAALERDAGRIERDLVVT